LRHTFWKSRICTAVGLSCIAAAASADMVLSSDTLTDGGTLLMRHVADMFGCDGDNLSPHLTWSGAPDATESFIVLAFDPDAPTASGWWHWAGCDVEASIDELPEGMATSESAANTGMIQVRNDFGLPSYVGACPPEGSDPHRYTFTVYAMPMDTLPVEGVVSPALLSFLGRNHAIAEASLTVTFGR